MRACSVCLAPIHPVPEHLPPRELRHGRPLVSCPGPGSSQVIISFACAIPEIRGTCPSPLPAQFGGYSHALGCPRMLQSPSPPSRPFTNTRRLVRPFALRSSALHLPHPVRRPLRHIEDPDIGSKNGAPHCLRPVISLGVTHPVPPPFRVTPARHRVKSPGCFAPLKACPSRIPSRVRKKGY